MDILHEQTGLRIWKNPKNGFVVARLHFTADPRKRSDEWIAASKRGMSRAQWEQEFNIDYNAHQGEKSFPSIANRRGEIVCHEGPYIDNLWDPSLTMWAGFDYGARNPSSFHVYTVVDGVTYALWELYEPCRNIIDFSAKLLACPYWPQIRYIVHDPSIRNLSQRNNQGNLVTVLSQFESLGITKWVAGNNDEAAWLSLMTKHWCGQEVTFKILDCCPMMIDEFTNATFASMTDKMLESQNYREKLVDKHNHALDDCKYFMNSGAAAPRRKHIAYPNLAASYGQGSGGGSLRTDRMTQLGL